MSITNNVKICKTICKKDLLTNYTYDFHVFLTKQI